MLKILLITLGGCLGTLSRYFINVLFTKASFASSFPYATLLINLVGCFLFGIAAALVTKKILPIDAGLFLMVGFLGAFTTFATYSFESYLLIEQGKLLSMLINIGIQTSFGIIFAALGYTLIIGSYS